MAANYTLDSLISDLKKSTYTPKRDEELRAAADNRYQSLYDQQRLAAQQATDTNQLALDRQLAGMGSIYGKQKEASTQQYARVYSQANRQAASRGMQRSSFNNATLGNIAVEGNKAQQEISDQEAAARTGIEEQKSLLARQLADQLKQYSASQAADTLAYLDELESKEYDRFTAATNQQNSLSAQIYQFANQEKQQDEASQQWLKQFNEQMRQYGATMAENQRQFNVLHPAKGGSSNKNINKGDNTGAAAGMLTYEQVQRILDAYKNGPTITGQLNPTSNAMINAKKNKLGQTTK